MRKLRLAFRNYESQPTMLRIMRQQANQHHDLDWDQVFIAGVDEAASTLFSGEADLIVGQHYTPYNDLLEGRSIVCIATGENVFRDRLVTSPDVKDVGQLPGRRLAVEKTSWDTCLGLSTRVWLDRMGVGDTNMEPVLVSSRAEVVAAVREGRADACMLSPKDVVRARAAGLVAHEDLPLLPCIQGVTITTRWDLVQEQPELVMDFLKSMIDAIHFWKTRREDTLNMMAEVERGLGRTPNQAEMEHVYQTFAQTLERKPYPRPEAILNAQAKCVKIFPEAAKVNPQIVWNIEPLREIDESGYIDELYGL